LTERWFKSIAFGEIYEGPVRNSLSLFVKNQNLKTLLFLLLCDSFKAYRVYCMSWEKTVIDLTQPESGNAPILPDEIPKSTALEPKIIQTQVAEEEVKKKRKKKKAKFGGSKKLQHLAKKWAVVDKERAKDTPDYKAKQKKRENAKWVLEQSGRSAEDNPNLIKVKDWRSKVGLAPK